MTVAAFGHITIVKQAPRDDAWWASAPREGFSAECRKRFGEFIAPDEMTDSMVAVYQRRADFLATVTAIRAGKQTAAVRRSVIVN